MFYLVLIYTSVKLTFITQKYLIFFLAVLDIGFLGFIIISHKDLIAEVICDAMDAYIPSKMVTKKTGDKTWFDDKCRRLAKRKRRIYHKSKKASTPEKKEKFVQARKAFNQAERNTKVTTASN